MRKISKKKWQTKKKKLAKNWQRKISKKKTGKIEIKKKNWQKIGEQNLPTSPGPYLFGHPYSLAALSSETWKNRVFVS